MRNEGPRVFQAVEEMIDITRRSGVHLQISHLKLMGKPQCGRAQELLDMGLDIPELTRVFLELRRLGLDVPPVYSVEQAVKALEALKGGTVNA